MPRGVWDRSKSKEDREAEKGTKSTKTSTTGRGRKAGAVKAAGVTHRKYGQRMASNVSHNEAGSSTHQINQGTLRLNALQSHLSSLVQAHNLVKQNTTISNRIEQSIVRLIDRTDSFLEELFSAGTEIQGNDTVKVELRQGRSANGTAQQNVPGANIPAGAQVAPVPFNPPTPIQG